MKYNSIVAEDHTKFQFNQAAQGSCVAMRKDTVVTGHRPTDKLLGGQPDTIEISDNPSSNL